MAPQASALGTLSAGTCTLQETPSFAWRTVTVTVNRHTPLPAGRFRGIFLVSAALPRPLPTRGTRLGLAWQERGAAGGGIFLRWVLRAAARPHHALASGRIGERRGGLHDRKIPYQIRSRLQSEKRPARLDYSDAYSQQSFDPFRAPRHSSFVIRHSSFVILLALFRPNGAKQPSPGRCPISANLFIDFLEL